MSRLIKLRSMIVYIIGIPLLCVSLLFIYFGYQKIKQQNIETMTTVLEERTSRQAAELNLFFGKMSRYIDSIASTITATGPLDQKIMNSLLRSTMEYSYISGAVIVYDTDVFPDGKAPLSSLVLKKRRFIGAHTFSKEEFYNYEYADWFLLPKLAGTGIWTDPMFSPVQKNIICAYSAPFFTDGVFQGVASLSVLVQDIRSNLEAINVEGSQLILVSQFGTIVAHPNKNSILRHTFISLAHERQSDALVALAYELRDRPRSGVARLERGILGDNEYLAYAPIPHTNWLLLSVIPESVALAPLMDDIWWGVIFVVVGSILVFIIVYWLSTKEIINPLRRLEDASKKLANGDLQVQAITYSNVSEIVSLEHTFNSMVLRLGESMAKEIDAGRARLYAEEASKAKSDFLARMSHEIRTPMNAILGLTHLALEKKTKDEQQSYLLKIQRASKNMLAILNDILDFSKIEAGKLELEIAPFYLDDLVSALNDVFAVAMREKGVSFSIEVDEKLPQCLLGDVLRLTQILLNLCNNAMKFTHQGAVTVTFKQLQADATSCMLEIWVQDTGIGITEEAQKQLFTKFNQADSSITRKFGGTGLGLAICRLLVDLMQGNISLESELGKGSLFKVAVLLGQVPASMLDLHLIKNDTLPPLPLDAKILVAEDNEINQEIIVALLENLGLSCQVVGNGKEVLQALAKAPIDLVLMDIQMPEMDGLLATKLLRSLNYTMPVLAMTANAMNEDKANCLEVGMNAHIAKPIDPEELHRQLAYWLNL